MGLKLDGCATVETIDSSGELLVVANHDISDLVEGRGVLNWEHSNKSDDIIGAIIYARKILKKEDCENDRQRYYWNIVKKPFVYIISELFDDDDVNHPGAVAVAAMIRYYAKQGERLLTNFSIEGATLERDDYILKETVGRRVACTLRACNKAAIAGLLEDPKSISIAKYISDVSDRVDHLIEIDSIILDDMFIPKDPILDLHKAVESLTKSIEAGMGNVAPSQLTGQAALTREHISGFQRNRVKAAVRDWDRKRPLKEVLKGALPEVSDDYIGHFEKLAEELALKKNMPSPKLVRIGAKHAHPSSDDDQKSLVEGLYYDPASESVHSSRKKKILHLRNDQGRDVLVKHRPEGPVGNRMADKEYTNAHNHFQIMKDVFGLGKYVPIVTKVAHPNVHGGNAISAMEYIKEAKTPLQSGDVLANAFRKHEKDGHIHKLIIANHILGVGDRHNGNLLVHPKGHLMSIDHDDAFLGWNGGFTEPDLISAEKGNDKLHPEAAKWLKGIDAKTLAGKMLDQGHDPATIKTAVSGLKYYQKLADRSDMSIGQMFDHAANHMTKVNAEERAKRVA